MGYLKGKDPYHVLPAPHFVLLNSSFPSLFLRPNWGSRTRRTGKVVTTYSAMLLQHSLGKYSNRWTESQRSNDCFLGPHPFLSSNSSKSKSTKLVIFNCSSKPLETNFQNFSSIFASFPLSPYSSFLGGTVDWKGLKRKLRQLNF